MTRRVGIAMCMLGVIFAAGQAEAGWWERKTDRKIDRRVDRKMDRKAERRDALIEPERPALERVSDRRIDRKAERAGERKKERRDDVRGAERRTEPKPAAETHQGASETGVSPAPAGSTAQ